MADSWLPASSVRSLVGPRKHRTTSIDLPGNEVGVQSSSGTLVADATLEDHAENLSQEVPREAKDDQREHLHNRTHQVNRKEGERKI